MSNEQENLYSILGVDRSASGEEIKKAYRKKAQENHPDKGGDKEEFFKIKNAYGILSNPGTRARYNRTGNPKGDIPQLRAKAMQEVAQMILTLIENADPDRTDYIKLAIVNFEMNRENVKKTIAKHEENLKKKKKIRKRFRMKKKDPHKDFIGNALDKDIEGIEFSIEHGKELIELANECIKVAGEYEYIIQEEQTIATLLVNFNV